jgi:hypothetical protein
MNNGMLLIGLMLAGLFLMRRPTQTPGAAVNWLGPEWSVPGTVGGYGEG